MVNRQRKMVMKEQCYIGNFDYSDLENIQKQIGELIKQYGKDAEIRMHCEAYSDSDKEYMYLFKSVPETDEEMNNRIAKEEQAEKMVEERNRSEYERLKKIFG